MEVGSIDDSMAGAMRFDSSNYEFNNEIVNIIEYIFIMIGVVIVYYFIKYYNPSVTHPHINKLSNAFVIRQWYVNIPIIAFVN